MKKKQGFTLIELLVVIAIIAMLLAILMPALGKVKKLAMRLVCGTNAKGLGTAMNVYAFDYNDEFPKQGGSGSSVWGERTDAYKNLNKDWDAADSSQLKSVNSSLYMLVREADVSPKSFICPASNDIEYKMSEDPGMTADNLNSLELTDLWDFGAFSGGGWSGDASDGCHNSYSYQQPYKVGTNRAYPADASGNAARAILADKSPLGDPDLKHLTRAANAAVPQDWKELVSIIDFEDSSSSNTVQIGNSSLHDREGQNILYNDGHAEFARRPDISINNDNIYTRKTSSDEAGRRRGNPFMSMVNAGWSNGSQDSVLVHDSQVKLP